MGIVLENINKQDIVSGTLEIPWGVTRIGRNACHSELIRRLVIPPTVQIIDGNAFRNCVKLEEIRFLSEHETDTPAKCSSLIPEGAMLIIGESAFQSCKMLKRVSFDNRVSVIGNDAFADCTRLKSVRFGSTLREIGRGAFRGCALKSVDIPDSTLYIGDKAFIENTYLTDVKFGAGLTEIGSFAFSGCESLESVYLPKHLQKMGESAFKDCSNLDHVEFNRYLKVIPRSAFDNCRSLSKVKFVSGLERISPRAFHLCLALTELDFPASLRVVENSAFHSCESLKRVSFKDGLSRIEEYAFADCDNIRSLTLPKGIDEIGAYAFSDSRALSSLNVKGVKKLHNKAFFNCPRLERVKLSADLQEIGEKVFKGASKIENAELNGDSFPIEEFGGFPYAKLLTSHFGWGDITTYRSFPDMRKEMYGVEIEGHRTYGEELRSAIVESVYLRCKDTPPASIIEKIDTSGVMDVLDYWCLTGVSYEDIQEIMESNSLSWGDTFTVSDAVDYSKGHRGMAKFAEYAEHLLIPKAS